MAVAFDRTGLSAKQVPKRRSNAMVGGRPKAMTRLAGDVIELLARQRLRLGCRYRQPYWDKHQYNVVD